MMHVGTAAGTVAAMALRDGIQPREIAVSLKRIREVQLRLVRGAGGHGTLLWPWHDVAPEDNHFEAANMLAIAGVWRAEKDSVFFMPNQAVTRRELATSLARLCLALPGEKKKLPESKSAPRFTDVPEDDEDRALIEAVIAWGDFGKQQPTFTPEGQVTWAMLNRWLAALKFPTFETLAGKAANYPLTRAEFVDFLYRVLKQRGD
jgi:hypothetical protein